MQARPRSTSAASCSARDGTGCRARVAAAAALAGAFALLATAGGALGADADALWPRYSDDPAANQRLAPREEAPAPRRARPAPAPPRPFVEEDSPQAAPAAPTPAPTAPEPPAAAPASPPAAPSAAEEAPARTVDVTVGRATAVRAERAVQPVADLAVPGASDGGRGIVLAALVAGSALLLLLSSLPPWLLRDARAADVVLRYRVEAAALGGLGLVFTVALWILL